MANQFLIARPYAKAVFTIALASNNFEGWEFLLKTLADIISDNKIRIILQNPKVTVQAKVEIFSDICKESVAEAGINFLKVLITNQRLLLVPQIFQLYTELKAEHEKIMNVRVISACKLTDQNLEKLSLVLQKKYKRKPVLQCEVDSELLGGLVVYVGDHVLDGSLLNQIFRCSKF